MIALLLTAVFGVALLLGLTGWPVAVLFFAGLGARLLGIIHESTNPR